MVLTWGDVCKFILAIIFPPLGVFAERGCNVDLLINIGLTLLGFIPGTIPLAPYQCFIIVSIRGDTRHLHHCQVLAEDDADILRELAHGCLKTLSSSAHPSLTVYIS